LNSSASSSGNSRSVPKLRRLAGKFIGMRLPRPVIDHAHNACKSFKRSKEDVFSSGTEEDDDEEPIQTPEPLAAVEKEAMVAEDTESPPAASTAAAEAGAQAPRTTMRSGKRRHVKKKMRSIKKMITLPFTKKEVTPKDGDEIVVETLVVYSSVTVVWQDGTYLEFYTITYTYITITDFKIFYFGCYKNLIKHFTISRCFFKRIMLFFQKNSSFLPSKYILTVFSVGESYWALLVARAVQGVGSACINICGMSLVAQHYPEEARRSKVMGIILGSIALGVLLGYPFGGILYDLMGKSAPFIILSTLMFLSLGLQLLTLDLSVQSEVVVEESPKWRPLLECKMILAIVLAIWFSTSTMAMLEPCLPIWLIQYLKPNKWQLGTVFIPDSVGYFVGTNFFGSIAYKYGQVKVSCISLVLVGVASILVSDFYKLL